VPPSRRASKATSRRGRTAWFGIQDAGRWSLVRGQAPLAPTAGASGPARGEAAGANAPARVEAADAASIEHVARILLRRYGVVCWRLMEREASWLPPWRELVRVYRRLEARGEIRGGRFIAGLSGEQYALPEAIALLRQVRRRPAEGTLVSVAAADPSNLLGSVVPGRRVARVAGARVLFRDGAPLATSIGGEIEWLDDGVPAAERPALRRRLESPQAAATSWPASSSSAFTSAE